MLHRTNAKLTSKQAQINVEVHVCLKSSKTANHLEQAETSAAQNWYGRPLTRSGEPTRVVSLSKLFQNDDNTKYLLFPSFGKLRILFVHGCVGILGQLYIVGAGQVL